VTRRARTVLASVEALAGTRRGAVVLFLLALAAYAIRAVAWPATSGRDLDEYLYDYIQLFDRHPLLPWSMLFRTPVTPVVAGLSLDVGGGFLVEPVLATLYALSIVAWAAVARTFGRRAALVTAIALLLYQGYALMFHELSSEPMFAAAFAAWALALVRAVRFPSVGRFALVGLATALCALVRPGNVVLVLFAALPLALPEVRRLRLRASAAFVAAALLPLAAWAVQNGLRFGDYTLARGGNGVIPFYRAFITDHIIGRDNGPASRRLAAAMQRHLLTRDPYKSYGVTLDELFRRGSFRVHEDLYVLSDEVFGWSSDYRVLRDAGIEGVRTHPGTYAGGVLRTIWRELSEAHFRLVASSGVTGHGGGTGATVVVRGKRLPKPTEGQPIPAGQTVWISRPDDSIREVWTSPTQHHFVFEKPGEKRRFDQIQRRLQQLFDALPHRHGNTTLALRLNQASRWYPRPYQWLAVGLIALAWRRPRESLLLVALPVAAVAVVVLNALGLFTDLHFVLPVAPAFVLFGSCAWLAPARSRRV